MNTKRKKAVALKYTQGERAPKVVAVGKGDIAEKILTIASAKGVPVLNKPELVEKLVDFKINQEIPPQLYEAVAEILAFIYSLNAKKDSTKYNQF